MRREGEGEGEVGVREIPKLPGSPGPTRSFSLYICRVARCSRKTSQKDG